MELINNTTKTLKDDLSVEIKKGSKLSIAAACFSIYAFQELKKQLTSIEELRFIFTSPTFVAEKTKKEKREFYIPRLNRERSLYGTEFEIIVVAVGSIDIDQGNTLDEQIEVNEKRQKLEKQIAKLEKQAWAEKQPKKKFELASQAKALTKQLAELE